MVMKKTESVLEKDYFGYFAMCKYCKHKNRTFEKVKEIQCFWCSKKFDIINTSLIRTRR